MESCRNGQYGVSEEFTTLMAVEAMLSENVKVLSIYRVRLSARDAVGISKKKIAQISLISSRNEKYVSGDEEYICYC